MKNLLSIWVVCLLGLFQVGCVPPSTPAPKPGADGLELQAGEVRMAQNGNESRPYFRMSLNVVNQKGESVPFNLTEGTKEENDPKLIQAIEVSKDGRTYHPFYVRVESDEKGGAAGQGSQPARQQQEPREWMLLLDTSGSMCLRPDETGDYERIKQACQNLPAEGTRFHAAKAAARGLVRRLRQGADRIAIVPFDSHRVAMRIRGAQFVDSLAEAEQQIENLPPPTATNNTALYSAAVEALKEMKGRRAKDGAVQQTLIILSDGVNGITPKDKLEAEQEGTQLLEDDQLGVVQATARESNVTTYTVGFGAQSDELKGALKAIAYPNERNYLQASGLQELANAFNIVLKRSAHQIKIMFYTDDADYGSMRTAARFTVRFGPPLPQVASQNIVWGCGITACTPDGGTLTTAELKALINPPDIKRDDPLPRPSVWRFLLNQLLIFSIFAGLLVGLWYGPPRLIWPPVSNLHRLPGEVHPGRMRGAIPHVPTVPQVPLTPNVPHVPNTPNTPGVPNGGEGGRGRFDRTVILNPGQNFDPKK